MVSWASEMERGWRLEVGRWRLEALEALDVGRWRLEALDVGRWRLDVGGSCGWTLECGRSCSAATLPFLRRDPIILTLPRHSNFASTHLDAPADKKTRKTREGGGGG